MSEAKTTEQTTENIPAFVKKAPELLPVWDWWVKEGKSTLTMILVIGVAVAGYYGVRNYLAARDRAANQALTNAYTADDLEAAVSSYGSTAAGPALKLRLAKAYFDAERYQEALEVYDGLSAKAGKIPAFADMIAVGRAYALEGLAKYKEAGDAYGAFAKDAAKTNSYLALTAQLGQFRCQALAGDKAGAVKALEDLKARQAADKVAEMRVERMIDAVKRYEPGRKPKSLFDAADAAEKAITADAQKKTAADKKAADKKAADKKAADKPAKAADKKAAEIPSTAAKPVK